MYAFPSNPPVMQYQYQQPFVSYINPTSNCIFPLSNAHPAMNLVQPSYAAVNSPLPSAVVSAEAIPSPVASTHCYANEDQVLSQSPFADHASISNVDLQTKRASMGKRSATVSSFFKRLDEIGEIIIDTILRPSSTSTLQGALSSLAKTSKEALLLQQEARLLLATTEILKQNINYSLKKPSSKPTEPELVLMAVKSLKRNSTIASHLVSMFNTSASSEEVQALSGKLLRAEEEIQCLKRQVEYLRGRLKTPSKHRTKSPSPALSTKTKQVQIPPEEKLDEWTIDKLMSHHSEELKKLRQQKLRKKITRELETSQKFMETYNSADLEACIQRPKARSSSMQLFNKREMAELALSAISDRYPEDFPDFRNSHSAKDPVRSSQPLSSSSVPTNSTHFHRPLAPSRLLDVETNQDDQIPCCGNDPSADGGTTSPIYSPSLPAPLSPATLSTNAGSVRSGCSGAIRAAGGANRLVEVLFRDTEPTRGNSAPPRQQIPLYSKFIAPLDDETSPPRTVSDVELKNPRASLRRDVDVREPAPNNDAYVECPNPPSHSTLPENFTESPEWL